MSAPYPWQRDQWRGLWSRRAQGRLPHALLLSGPAGTGKDGFARALASALLCEDTREDGHACGQCRACAFAANGAHPDLLWVTPQEDSKYIRVDQVRGLTATLGLTSQFGGYRIAVLSPAERMNAEAANSLLKTLEEPGPDTVMMLVTAQPGRLPATVRSRCQAVPFPLPDTDIAARWLQAQDLPGRLLSVAQGAPLSARRLAHEDGLARRDALFGDFGRLLRGRGDPVAIAQRCVGEDPAQCLTWLGSWIADLIRLRASPRAPRLGSEDLRADLQALSATVDSDTLYCELDRLQEAMRLLQSQVSAQTLLEQVLIPLRKPAGGR